MCASRLASPSPFAVPPPLRLLLCPLHSLKTILTHLNIPPAPTALKVSSRLDQITSIIISRDAIPALLLPFPPLAGPRVSFGSALEPQDTWAVIIPSTLSSLLSVGPSGDRSNSPTVRPSDVDPVPCSVNPSAGCCCCASLPTRPATRDQRPRRSPSRTRSPPASSQLNPSQPPISLRPPPPFLCLPPLLETRRPPARIPSSSPTAALVFLLLSLTPRPHLRIPRPHDLQDPHICRYCR